MRLPKLLTQKPSSLLMVKAAVVLILFSVYQFCWFPGCYGPFEITIKAENGEYVEDVIVTLSHTTAGAFENMTSTYKKRILANTDEVIRFPRGFVYLPNDKEYVYLDFGISHPDYQNRDSYAKGLEHWGTIELGDEFIGNKQDINDRSNAKYTKQLREEGMSEAEIDKKLEGKRVLTPLDRSYVDYFARAVAIGRKDIVDKYLASFLEQEIAYKESIGKPETYSFDELYQLHIDAIDKKSGRL